MTDEEFKTARCKVSKLIALRERLDSLIDLEINEGVLRGHSSSYKEISEHLKYAIDKNEVHYE